MWLKSHHWIVTLLLASTFAGCKPEHFTYPDNPIPAYDEISTILVQNYVNRLYIDLIGREPTDAEMDRDVFALEADSLKPAARLSVIDALVHSADSTNQIPYTVQYHDKLYSDLKARFLEGASDAVLNERYGVLRAQAINDSINGNWASYSINQAGAERLEAVLECPEALMSGEINIREACHRMIWNAIYDQINMNSFNFVNATFDDLYQRFPTQSEFDAGYAIVEYNLPGILFGTSANDKPSYIDALLLNSEWDEGIVRWQYRGLLARDPSDEEVLDGLDEFALGLYVSDIQRLILMSDEYAGF